MFKFCRWFLTDFNDVSFVCQFTARIGRFRLQTEKVKYMLDNTPGKKKGATTQLFRTIMDKGNKTLTICLSIHGG